MAFSHLCCGTSAKAGKRVKTRETPYLLGFERHRIEKTQQNGRFWAFSLYIAVSIPYDEVAIRSRGSYKHSCKPMF